MMMAELPIRDKLQILTGLMLAMFLGSLDQTIVATALPRIVEDLQGLDRYVWVATAYLLASTVLVPVYGKLADTYSRKAIELWAIGLFLGGSFLCGIAGEFGDLPVIGSGMNQLILFRAIQGVGSAGLFGLAFIIIADLFEARERARYQGFVGAVFGVSSILGPLIGGLLTDHGGALVPGIEGWRWVFYVNLPVGVVATWFVVTKMPSLHPPGGRGALDWVGAVLMVGGLVPLIFGLQVDKSQHPWTSPETLGLFGGAAALLTAFGVRSLRVPNPMLELRLFKVPVFRMANLSLFFLGGGFLSLALFLPLFMVNVLGVSATRAGVSLIPLSLGLVAGATASGQLVARIGHYRRLMLVGAAVLLGGLYLMSTVTADVSYTRVTVYMLICGLGVGPSMPLYTLAVQNAVEPRFLGQATSATQFFRQIGGAVGAALLGAVLSAGLASSFAGLGPAAGAPRGEGGRLQGLAEVEAGIRAGFDARYTLVERAARLQDAQARARLTADPAVPGPIKAALGQGALPPDAVEELLVHSKAALDAAANTAVESSLTRLRHGFATAIAGLYRYAMVLVALGALCTLFIPDLPLKSRAEVTGQGGGH